MKHSQKNGTLFLIPVDLGHAVTDLFAPYHLNTLRHLGHFVAERAKTARAFLKAMEHPLPMKDIHITELDKHQPDKNLDDLLRPVFEGHDLGFMSEAGLPCIADPGFRIVDAAHKRGIRVIPLAGPSSLMLALMASGLNGQNFAFRSYLPQDKDELRKTFQSLKKEIDGGQTQLFIETPYRNNQLLDAMCAILPKDNRLCIACDLSLETEWIRTLSISEWNNQPAPDLHKRPCIFVLGKKPT